MHAIDLVKLASTFVQLALPMAELRLAPRRSSAQDLWLTSRYRQENWLYCLARHRDAIMQPNTSRRIQLWREIIPVIQEVLLAEPLTRMIAYSASLWSNGRLDSDLAPLANSSLAAHIEARNRCLHLIVFGQGLAVDNAAKINRLRRNLECFTDQLLARLPPLDNPGLYAFEPHAMRRRQVALRSLARQSNSEKLLSQVDCEQTWQVLQRDLECSASANSRLNSQISQHTLGLFPAGCFDSLGLPHSPRSLQRRQPTCDSPVRQDCEHPLFKRTSTAQSETQRIQLHSTHRRRYRRD